MKSIYHSILAIFPPIRPWNDLNKTENTEFARMGKYSALSDSTQKTLVIGDSSCIEFDPWKKEVRLDMEPLALPASLSSYTQTLTLPVNSKRLRQRTGANIQWRCLIRWSGMGMWGCSSCWGTWGIGRSNVNISHNAKLGDVLLCREGKQTLV